jgi:hypothetical protein
MEDQEKDKIIGRIKKLMALGMKAPETPEAQSAMAKAKELMDKHCLHTIDMNDDGTLDEKDILRMDIDFEGRSDWEAQILCSVRDAFQVKYLWDKHNKKHLLIGSKTDIDFSSFLFKFVRLQIKKMGDQYNYSAKDMYTYYMGAALSAGKLINDAFGKAAIERAVRDGAISAENMALIVVKNDAVDRVFTKMFPKTSKGRIGAATGSHSAFANGKRDGSTVKLNRQIGGNHAGVQTGRGRLSNN